jgi:uncharacterized membrane protein
MALVINNPAETHTDDTGIGMILGVIIALLAIALLAVYAFPALRRQTRTTPNSMNINDQVPNPTNNNSGPGGSSPNSGGSGSP